MKLSCEENVSFYMADMARHVKRIRRIHVAWRPTWVGTSYRRAEYLLLIGVLFAREHITYVRVPPTALTRSFSLFFGVRAAAIAENGGIVLACI